MENTLMVRKRFSSAERRKLLDNYQQSGMTQRQYAAQAGISLSCLQLWLRQSSGNMAAPAAVRFVEMPPLGSPISRSRRGYGMRFPGGVSLEIPPGFDPEELARLCRICEAL